MRRAIALLAAAPLGAMVVDRVAVAIGNTAITESSVREQLRAVAFLNGTKPEDTPLERRRTADRMVEQTLVRREMELSQYPPPEADEAAKLIDAERERRRLDAAGFDQALAAAGLTRDSLRRLFLFQIAIGRFLDLRFRPGVSLTDAEVETYYRETYVPAWAKENPGKAPPELDVVRDSVEQVLTGWKLDEALDRWLEETRKNTRVVFHEEAFQ